jgi:WhiB family redox-sensing transcriptional regulator
VTIALIDFQDQGACRDHDPELFFPVSASAANAPQIEQAKAVCMRCPVLETCRAYALAHNIQGIWGGMTEEERRQMRAREQQRQRELAAAQAVEEPVDEPADNEEQVAVAVPSYQVARQRLTRANRALRLANEAGDAPAIEAAQARVAAAREQLDAVRDHQRNLTSPAQTSERHREYRAARNQLTRARRCLELARVGGEPDNVIEELEQRVAAAIDRVEAAKVGNSDEHASSTAEAVA